MMQLTPRLILGYLHHDRATLATEQLQALEVISLPYAKAPEQRRAIARLQRAAAGDIPVTEAEAYADRKAEFDAGWAALRARLGSGVIAVE
jgi:hypothetical protein